MLSFVTCIPCGRSQEHSPPTEEREQSSHQSCPRARADMPAGGTYAVSPRVSATVLALEPQGLATIRTTTGATSEVVQHPSWQVGDQVACKRVASAHVQVPWERLDCQKVSD